MAGDERAIFCASVDARTRCSQGDRIRLTVDPERFHYFDPRTGLALVTEAKAATG